jgi:hypothetical protein
MIGTTLNVTGRDDHSIQLQAVAFTRAMLIHMLFDVGLYDVALTWPLCWAVAFTQAILIHMLFDVGLYDVGLYET